MTNCDFILPSPVKLNLFLHITGRRKDGYHLLQTLFQLLDYGDSIGFEQNTTGHIGRIDQHNFDIPEEDLCVKAARLLHQHTGQAGNGVNITLNKIIPPGSGLGAGSSNAATVLLGLNKLWNLNLDSFELMDIGALLGADVPLFIHGQTAWAEGTGEQLTTCSQPKKWFFVLLPKVQVSTERIFAEPDLIRNHPGITMQDFANGGGENTVEQTTVKLYPEVGVALNTLSPYGSAKMSGTGASVFLTTDTKEQAQAVMDKMPSDTQGFIAQGCNLSPLHQQLGLAI